MKTTQLQTFVFNGDTTINGFMYEGQPVFLAVQVAKALDYADPHQALMKNCKSLIKLDSVCATELNKINNLGIDVGPKGLILLKESDLYRLIMKSRLPSAEKFQDWVVEVVLPSIRRTGEFRTQEAAAGSKEGLREYRLKKAKELESRAVEIRARARQIELENMEKLFAMLPHLGQESRQAYAAEVFGTHISPMPKLERMTLSATEVGDALGLSANQVGRLTNEHGLKTSQYGKWFLYKPASSAKQVETFRYYDTIIPVLQNITED